MKGARGIDETQVQSLAEAAALVQEHDYPSRTDVYAERDRRMSVIVGGDPNVPLSDRIAAGVRRATKLQNQKLLHLQDPDNFPDWTPLQAGIAAHLSRAENALEVIEYAAENLLHGYEKTPQDFKENDGYWE